MNGNGNSTYNSISAFVRFLRIYVVILSTLRHIARMNGEPFRWFSDFIFVEWELAGGLHREKQVLAHIPPGSLVLAVLGYAPSFEPQVRDSYFTSL